jgi:hypothetical protein
MRRLRITGIYMDCAVAGCPIAIINFASLYLNSVTKPLSYLYATFVLQSNTSVRPSRLELLTKPRSPTEAWRLSEHIRLLR